MKTMNKTRVCLILFLSCICLASLSLTIPAAESPGEKAVGKELEKEIGMPILDGDLWMKMSPDGKMAFVWGIWHVVSIEHHLATKYPDLKKENFSAKVTEGTRNKPMTMNEVVSVIDKYYQENPDEINKPVVAVIWSTMVKPNITAGIDGKPLSP